MYGSFDANPSVEVRGCFLDIRKAFDRVWHEGLFHKIKCLGVKSDLLTLIEYFLFERQQRVVLNGQESEWLTIKAGLNSWSIVSFIYINDLLDNLKSNVKLLADDISMFLVVGDPIITSQKLNNGLDRVSL